MQKFAITHVSTPLWLFYFVLFNVVWYSTLLFDIVIVLWSRMLWYRLQWTISCHVILSQSDSESGSPGNSDDEQMVRDHAAKDFLRKHAAKLIQRNWKQFHEVVCTVEKVARLHVCQDPFLYIVMLTLLFAWKTPLNDFP